MKSSTLIAVVCFLSVGAVFAQPISAQASQQAAAAPKIDPAKEADILRLLDLVGTKDLLIQSFGEMSKSLKPVLTNSLPPGEYREKLIDLFLEKFTAKENLQQFVELAIPAYDKNFSRQEILSLIEFYQTPLGRKTISVLPKLTADLQEEGRKWGENLGRQAMTDVLTQHPDLAEALQKASDSAKP